MADFITKDSGTRQAFSTGAVRDDGAQKSRPDLMSPFVLWRDGEHLARGAEKYGEHNYEKGIPLARTFASLMRHALQYAMGDRTEDHLAAVRFNAGSMMHVEEMIVRGILPAELDDMPTYQKPLRNEREVKGSVAERVGTGRPVEDGEWLARGIERSRQEMSELPPSVRRLTDVVR